MNELDNKIRCFVAAHTPGLSMRDYAVLCEGIMTLISDHVTQHTQGVITLHSRSIRASSLVEILDVSNRRLDE